jgi:hypothetical protein
MKIFEITNPHHQHHHHAAPHVQHGDYEVDGEFGRVEFVRDEAGVPHITRVTVGSTDITAIENLPAIAETIAPEDESPLEDVFIALSIDVGGEYNPAERGSREHGSGIQLEPDYDAYTEVTDIIAYGNGKHVNMSMDDFPPRVQEEIQGFADSQNSRDDDYYDGPEPDYYDEAVNDIKRLSGLK